MSFWDTAVHCESLCSNIISSDANLIVTVTRINMYAYSIVHTYDVSWYVFSTKILS